MQDKTALGISEPFREFIEALVEEVVINGEPFDAQKKWLRKNSEAEGVSYETIESNLNDLFEAIKELEEHESRVVERSVRLLARESDLSEALVNKILDNTSLIRAKKGSERKAQEEKERKEREEESEQKQTTGELNGHEWVDLGLPSGTLWAICNVGATKPEEYGGYFAWGETTTKGTYNWDFYKYANGDWDTLTKYCKDANYSNNGFVDNLTELQTSDDPATTNWGKRWRTPSQAQWDELLAHTTIQRITCNGVTGRLFTSKKNGQTLFLPAASFRWDGDPYYFDHSGYWSRSLDTDYSRNALLLSLTDCRVQSRCRGYGFSVRPVHKN